MPSIPRSVELWDLATYFSNVEFVKPRLYVAKFLIIVSVSSEGFNLQKILGIPAISKTLFARGLVPSA